MASKLEPSTSMNIRAVPILLLRQIKSIAALQGKTLREWVIEAIQEKIRKAK
jgi:predicted HicB family RNase H-like nuclease